MAVERGPFGMLEDSAELPNRGDRSGTARGILLGSFPLGEVFHRPPGPAGRVSNNGMRSGVETSISLRIPTISDERRIGARGIDV